VTIDASLEGSDANASLDARTGGADAGGRGISSGCGCGVARARRTGLALLCLALALTLLGRRAGDRRRR
jgi:hypothetical protein